MKCAGLEVSAWVRHASRTLLLLFQIYICLVELAPAHVCWIDFQGDV